MRVSLSRLPTQAVKLYNRIHGWSTYNPFKFFHLLEVFLSQRVNKKVLMLPILETSLAHNTKETRMNLKGALIEFASGKSMHLDEEL